MNKKVFAFILAMFATFVLAGCLNNTQDSVEGVEIAEDMNEEGNVVYEEEGVEEEANEEEIAEEETNEEEVVEEETEEEVK